jgi:Cu(I)/Ag(I) efflux system membrane protein CusA/SilA
MKRIAAPMIGGVVTSAILELLIYPVIFVIWRRRSLQPEQCAEPPGEDDVKPETAKLSIDGPQGKAETGFSVNVKP